MSVREKPVKWALFGTCADTITGSSPVCSTIRNLVTVRVAGFFYLVVGKLWAKF